MGIAPEVVDGERFVRAWKRFRERFPEEQIGDEHRDMLQQYVETALFYQEKVLRIQGCEQGHALIDALTGISAEAGAIVESRCSTALPSPYRVPRPNEFLKRRRQLVAAASASALTERTESAILPTSPRMQAAQQSPEDEATEMMDFSYDDLKSMMETKKLVDEDHSTQELRRRLGLHDRDSANREAMSSETIAREEQESIQADMVNLAKTLKARTQTINESLVDDVKILDAVGQSAESNTVLLDRENAALKKQLASSIGLWTSLCLVMGAVMVFIATYIYMKLFSRRL